MAVAKRLAATSLAMLARYWEPGRVKTRLAQRVGDRTAAALHRAFVETLARRLGQHGERRLIAVTPDQQAGEVATAVGPLWAVTGQGEGDLGERLERVFRLLLASSQNAVVIGSDSPDLPIERIETAFAQLRSHAGVLGISADGGYYLLGLAGPWTDRYRHLFEGIEWGTDRVAEQTRERMREAEIECHELGTWFDVDRFEDLTPLQERLERNLPSEPLGREILQILGGAGRSETSQGQT